MVGIFAQFAHPLFLDSLSLSSLVPCLTAVRITCTSCLAMFILISSQYEIFDSKNGLSDWLKFGNIMLESAFGIAKTKHTHTAIRRDFDGLATGSSYFLIIHLFIFISLTLSLSRSGLNWFYFIVVDEILMACTRTGVRAPELTLILSKQFQQIYMEKKICESNTKPPYTCHSVYIETYYIHDEFAAHCLFRLGYATYSHRWSSMLIKIHNSE